MGMIFVARRLTNAEATAVRGDADSAAELLADEAGEADAQGRLLDLDKSWHGIHFLLTGTAWDCDCPAGQAILGGEAIGEDMGYGPARLLHPPEVNTVAAALTDMDLEGVRLRYSAGRLEELDIYPKIWDEADVLEEYLIPNLSNLISFYTDAAANDAAVLLAIT